MASELEWREARALAESGRKVRRASWSGRFIRWSSANYHWFLQNYNVVTGAFSEAERVIEMSDVTEDDYNSTDWTDEDVPGQT